MKGPIPFEEEVELQKANLLLRVNEGLELGACRALRLLMRMGEFLSPALWTIYHIMQGGGKEKRWNSVNGGSKIVAWSGLGIPVQLSVEEHKRLSKYDFAPDGNKKLVEFFQNNIIQGDV